jgi:hypothetical protein
MLRPPLSLAAVVMALLVCPGGVQASGWGLGQSGEHLVAIHREQQIPLEDVYLYHCHDLDAPVIRCFNTADERNADLILEANASVASGAPSDSQLASALSAASVTYVLWYDAIDFGGTSFTATGPVPNLGALGWDNKISSFKSTNGGHPRWWDYTSYSGSNWFWSTSAWVSYVGDAANDRFSSVQNVP